jgi:hypothetical protein
MSNFYLRLEAQPGSDIEAAAGEACVLAAKLDIVVTFDFNGVHCMAIPGGSSSALVENWRNELTGKSQYPIASSHRRAQSEETKP